MRISEWWEATFSAEKFTAQKGLKHVKKDYHTAQAETGFEAVFIDLAEEEIQKQKRLLSLEEIERIAHRARIQARHKTRSQAKTNSPITQEEAQRAEGTTPRTIGTLSKEMYDRLDKQLQSIKTTTNPLLSEGELSSVRNLKLKNAEENILKIAQELATYAKARNVNKETDRAYRLEINRWTELARKVNARLDRKVSSIEFKEYVSAFEKSFQETRRKA